MRKAAAEIKLLFPEWSINELATRLETAFEGPSFGGTDFRQADVFLSWYSDT